MEQKKGILITGGALNTQTIVTIAIGAALYGVLMVYAGIPIYADTNITVAMIVPVIVGAMFGPLPALICCGIGNIIADLVGGWGMNFDWTIGNAVMGFFVGMLPVYGARITEGVFKIKHMIIYALCCIVGNVIAYGVVTPIFASLFYARMLRLSLINALFASVGNIIVLLVIGIPVLIILAKRYASRMNLTEEPTDEK